MATTWPSLLYTHTCVYMYVCTHKHTHTHTHTRTHTPTLHSDRGQQVALRYQSQYTATSATHYNILQRCNTLQHTATHYKTHLLYIATDGNTLPSITSRSTLQHTATHCNKMQHTATHCKTAKHCNTLQNTPAIHSNRWQ